MAPSGRHCRFRSTLVPLDNPTYEHIQQRLIDSNCFNGQESTVELASHPPLGSTLDWHQQLSYTRQPDVKRIQSRTSFCCQARCCFKVHGTQRVNKTQDPFGCEPEAFMSSTPSSTVLGQTSSSERTWRTCSAMYPPNSLHTGPKPARVGARAPCRCRPAPLLEPEAILEIRMG